MSAPNFPVSLEKVFFTRSIVTALAEFKPELPVNIQPENKIDLSLIEGEQHRYISTMRTVINKENSPLLPYMIDMECIGVFLVDEKLGQEEAKRAVTEVSHNVLYGAIREMICTQTSRQPYGPIMLGLSILQPATATASKAP